jgi:hypothetical protein
MVEEVDKTSIVCFCEDIKGTKAATPNKEFW